MKEGYLGRQIAASEQGTTGFNKRLDNVYTVSAAVFAIVLASLAGCMTGTMIRGVHQIGVDYQPRITDTMNPGVAQAPISK